MNSAKVTAAATTTAILPPLSGEVTLKVPKLKGIFFETAIIERYRRRKSSVEEALIEMYLEGVSVRRVEDITLFTTSSAIEYFNFGLNREHPNFVLASIHPVPNPN